MRPFGTYIEGSTQAMFTDSSQDTISILYTIVSINVLWRLCTNWGSFWDDKVTAADGQLADAIAVFLLIPIGVFFHEVGHALATLQMGGTVEDFQWRIFWGYVVPGGSFTLPQWWWLAFSGNLVSILLGAIAFPLARLTRRQILQLMLLTFGRVQLVYSLVLYPLISFVGQRGDWLLIYNWSIWPYAQFTLVIHVLLLMGLWRLNQRLTASTRPSQPSPEDAAPQPLPPLTDERPPSSSDS